MHTTSIDRWEEGVASTPNDGTSYRTFWETFVLKYASFTPVGAKDYLKFRVPQHDDESSVSIVSASLTPHHVPLSITSEKRVTPIRAPTDSLDRRHRSRGARSDHQVTRCASLCVPPKS